ncbi:uncharacterized protein LOC127717466 [Mytilus californianus]|uniref:uncharacterized protein LOC127717466 n=1 Tax=Mytilus californianus TaxID=6549 RepID=UPI0022478510|nr:uncharacterized protein LOC127717466 [Mytilus californianus]
MNFGSCILKLLAICVISSSGLHSISSKIKVRGTITKNGQIVVRGVEGKELKIVCNLKSDIPEINLFMKINREELKRVGSGRLRYRFIPSKRDNMKPFVCSANSSLLDNPLSRKVLLDIQYAPVVKIRKKVTKKKLKLICIPSGNPENYTFDDWEHWSEFNEHIRNVQGTSDGKLIFLKSNNNNRFHENDGIYKCKTSNGINGTNGSLSQKGSVLIHNKVPPIFVNANKPIQYGRYGQKIQLKVQLYNKYGTIQTTISKQNETLDIHGRQERILTQDMFHGVNVTVSGIKITFRLTLAKIKDFTDYTIKACNNKECNVYTVKVTSKCRPEPPPYVSVIPYARYLKVVWDPGFDGGYQQIFFVEYQQEAENTWRRSGPVIDTKQIIMSKIVNELIPKTRYCVRVLSKNEIGESNKTAVTSLVTLADSPKPPTNVSVIPYKRHLTVSWCPEYNGGAPQTFFIEYHQEANEIWRRSGPITDNMQARMSHILYNNSARTRYFVRMLSKNEIGESNKTSITPVITLAERPEPPTNVSVIPYKRHLAVSWCPGYNGGDPQTFFIEYQQKAGEMWTRSGPIIENMKVRMSNVLYNMSPKRRYFVRMFSRNEIGESEKTAVTPVMTLEPTINIYRVKAVLVVLLIAIAVVLAKALWVVLVFVLVGILAISGWTIIFFIGRKEKGASGNSNPREEEVRENFQVEPVDNQLYLSSDDPDIAHVRNLRNQSVINTSLPSSSHDNQTNQMQLYNEDGANGRRLCTYINRGVISSVHNRQICETSLNYTEIAFNEPTTMQDAAIHGTCGSVSRTIYSEIDLMADPVAPLSSSGSECDESFESDI